MAAHTGNDTAGLLKYYPTLVETSIYEGLTQFTDGFNAASGGAIRLEDGANPGRRTVSDYYEEIDPVQDRDPTEDSATLTPSKFSNAQKSTIKKFHAAPVEYTRQEWVDRKMVGEDAQRLYGLAYGQRLAQIYLNTAVAALVGAIPSATTVAANTVHDGTAAVFGYDVLNEAMILLGDNDSLASTLVSRSKPIRNLAGAAYDSSQIAFQFGSTVIRGGALPMVGMQLVKSDIPALRNTSPDPDEYDTLVLFPGAVTIKMGPSTSSLDKMPGAPGAVPHNMTWLLNTESEFEIEIKGVSWKAASVDNPSDAVLSTPANWEEASDDNALKGPGIIIRTQ